MKGKLNGSWILAAIAIVVIAIIAYFLFFKKSSKDGVSTSSTSTSTGSTSGSSTSGSSSSSSSITASAAFPLKYGSRGAEVSELQKALNAAFEANKKFVFAGSSLPVKPLQKLNVDSIWGDKTQAMFKWAAGGATSLSEADYNKYIK